MKIINNQPIFEKIETEQQAYWLGFLYADGAIGSKEDKIELALAAIDKEHVEKFKNFIGIPNKISYRSNVKAYRYSFRSTKIKQDLIALGCGPQKSLTLEWPNNEQVPLHLKPAFLRGYFDGDGWFSNTDKCFQIGIIGSENFINGFLNYMTTINIINTNLTIQNVHRENGAKRYMFSKYDDIKNFLDFIYKDSTIYLERKYQHYQDFLKIGKLK